MATPNDSFVYPVTGVKTGYDKVNKTWPARKEIDEFLKDPKQALLFMWAYDKMKNRPLTETLSYFQLAGIHGEPKLPWPREGGPGSGSYCHHNDEKLFAPWHRAYVLLFEQAMHKLIMEFVDINTSDSETFIPKHERSEWLPAAETFRLPYWDFALRRRRDEDGTLVACLPASAMVEKNPQLMNPDTDNPQLPPIPITNPIIPVPGDSALFAYKPPLKSNETLKDYGVKDALDGNGDVKVPLTIQRQTVRYAPYYIENDTVIKKAWINGWGDLDRLRTIFKGQTNLFRQDLRTCLKDHRSSFDNFILRAPKPSLLSVHNQLHVRTGSDLILKKDPVTGNDVVDKEKSVFGNMASVPAAAFDPIFFLYHCGIDRLIALWQAGHPGQWIDNEEVNNADLWPFRVNDPTQEKYWKPKDLQDIQDLGYTYPEIAKINNQQSLNEEVDRLYRDIQTQPRGVAEGARGISKSEDPELIDIDNPPPDYLITANFELHEIGPFAIIFFIDEDYSGTRHEVGFIGNFVNSKNAGCDNCKRQSENHEVISLSTHLTVGLFKLFDQGIIEFMNADYIEQILEKHLRWTVVALPNARVVPIEEFPSMKVSVSRVDKVLAYDPNADVPRGGRPEFRAPTKPSTTVRVPSATAGKPGGVGEGDDCGY